MVVLVMNNTTTETATKPSRVFFSTDAYVRNYGRGPRGRGSWAFCPMSKYRLSNYLDFVFWAPGLNTYAEAKKLAAAHFAAKGITNVTVCT